MIWRECRMKWYQMDVDTVEQKLHVTTNHGLTDKQAEQRRKQYGPNRLESEKNTSRWLIFLKQFQDFMVLILLAATLIAGMLGEYVDAIAIMTIVLVNGFLGYFQEQKAEKSLSKLKEMSAPIADVLRDGKWEKVPSQEVVVGDVVRINSGDRIPADIRITKSSSLETEESALTGESLPVMKQIASLMVQTKKTTTPLEHKLAELGKILIAVALLLTAMVVLVGVYQGHPVYNMFLAGVSLAVAAIPEGLPAIVTVALSLGV